MNKRLGLIIAIGLALLGTSLGYLVAVRYTSEGGPPSPQTSQAPSTPGAAAIEESTIKHSEKGRMAWKVRLQNLKLESGAGAVAAEKVKEALVYDESGRPVIRMTARKVAGNTRSRNLQLTGDVRAVSPEGAVFDTQLIDWSQEQMKLVSPGPVTMKSHDTVVHAQSCEFFVEDNIVKSQTQVRMTIGKSTFTGTNLTYNVQTDDFQLSGVQGLFHPQELREEVQR